MERDDDGEADERDIAPIVDGIDYECGVECEDAC